MSEPVAWAVWERGGDLIGYVATHEEADVLVGLVEDADLVNDGIHPAQRYQVTPVHVRQPHEFSRARVWEAPTGELTEDEIRLREDLAASGLERHFLANETLQAEIAHAREHPEERVERPARDERASGIDPEASEEDLLAGFKDEIRSRPRWSEADADGNVTVHERHGSGASVEDV